MLGDFHQIYHELISIYPFMLNLPLVVTVTGLCVEMYVESVPSSTWVDLTE